MKSENHYPLGSRLAVGIDDATKLTGLSRSRLYQLIGEKKLRTKHIGRRHLILVSSLHELLGEAA
jgi:predicted DNA-binding transcriptional regulator AlpA